MFILRSLVLLLALFACISDLKTGTVKNEIVIIGAAIGLIVYMRYLGFYALPTCLVGGLIPLIPGYLLFHYRMIGAGDVKLLTAIGCIIGMNRILTFLFWTFLCAGGISCAIMMKNGIFQERMTYLEQWFQKRFILGERIPYRRSEGSENFHFTVAVLAAALLYAGGAI